MNKSQLFSAAHRYAKKNNKKSYRKAFASALRHVYYIQKQIQDAAKAVAEGDKFNGKVYQKNNGKTWCLLYIYVDNQFVRVAQTEQVTAQIDREVFLSSVGGSKYSAPKQNKRSGMSYDEAYSKYGLDFAEEGELHGKDIFIG
ncbi:MAG: hypothetical protein ACFB0B_20735 [Thermonemataceae bacterium]